MTSLAWNISITSVNNWDKLIEKPQSIINWLQGLGHTMVHDKLLLLSLLLNPWNN